jgi:hypothetical protein
MSLYVCMDIRGGYISINLLCMYVCMNEFIGVKSAWRLQTVTFSTQKTRFICGYTVLQLLCKIMIAILVHTYMHTGRSEGTRGDGHGRAGGNVQMASRNRRDETESGHFRR